MRTFDAQYELNKLDLVLFFWPSSHCEELLEAGYHLVEMLMAARSSGSPAWPRRPLAASASAGSSAASLRAIAGFMASSGPKPGVARGSPGSGSDVEATEDEWEDLKETMEDKQEDNEEDNYEDELVAFRDAEFADEDDDSEYAPSEGEEDLEVAEVDEDDRSVAALFAKYVPRRPRSTDRARMRSLNLQKSGRASSDSDDGGFGEQDAVLWEDEDDKRRWVSRYHAADREFRRVFGCSIDSQAHPGVKRRLSKERMRRPAYTLLVVALVVMYTAQLCGVSLSTVLSAASSTGKSIAMMLTETSASFAQPHDAEEIANDVRFSEEIAAHQLSASVEANYVDEVSEPQTEATTTKYVKAANDLCSNLLYRVVMSGRAAKVTHNAESACDIGVKLAPFGSVEAVVAHAQRGDLRSVLGEFQRADDDYTVAQLGLLTAHANFDDGETQSVMQDAVLDKTIANRWIQLYTARDVETLIDQVATMAGDISPNELAIAWMRVFRRELSVLEGLTMLRLRTLGRLSKVIVVEAE